MKVYQGPSTASDAMIVSSFKGALGDARVRQALSMAIDRQPLIDQLYKGAAQLPRALSNPGTWGYAPDVFKAAWDQLPDPKVDLTAAKALIQQAGADGQDDHARHLGGADPAEHRGAGRAVRGSGDRAEGEAEVHLGGRTTSTSSSTPRRGRDVDGFFTINYGDYADPAALLSTLVLPGRLAELRRLRQP